MEDTPYTTSMAPRLSPEQPGNGRRVSYQENPGIDWWNSDLIEPRLPFLGQGWAFPPEFSSVSNDVGLIAGAKDIESSLFILMGTLPGERKMHPNYGVDLSILQFEALTLSLETRMVDQLGRAILQFEPRIRVEEIVFHSDPWKGIIFIDIDYIIQRTNTRHNLVYPYYLLGGQVR
jgi:uncharacterized protein